MENNIFEEKTVNQLVSRINQLTHDTTPQWGKMNVGQMLAHCSVAYEMAYENTHKRPNAFARFMLKAFVKPMVVNGKPYKKNGRTAPQFLMTTEKDFSLEKIRLVDYITKTKSLGETHFEQKESHSFGKLNAKEWSNSFYYHLDHHLTQFGAK
jgi:hypothetical protein